MTGRPSGISAWKPSTCSAQNVMTTYDGVYAKPQSMVQRRLCNTIGALQNPTRPFTQHYIYSSLENNVGSGLPLLSMPWRPCDLLTCRAYCDQDHGQCAWMRVEVRVAVLPTLP